MNNTNKDGSLISVDELVSEFERLARSQSCTTPRQLVLGSGFERGRGNAVFSVYWPEDGHIEVAIAETQKKPNISRIYNRSPSDVAKWIDYLQTDIGHCAQPQKPHYYPRVSISTFDAGRKLAAAMLSFFEGKEYASPKEGQSPQPEIRSQVDERTLAAILTRRGQAEFRTNLISAYGSRCAITNCDVIEVLEAAHVIPFAEDQNYYVTNGILLRADVHTLFDLNLLSIDPETLVVRIAPHLRDAYGCLEGKEIRFPDEASSGPDKDRLAVHYRRWLIQCGRE